MRDIELRQTLADHDIPALALGKLSLDSIYADAAKLTRVNALMLLFKEGYERMCLADELEAAHQGTARPCTCVLGADWITRAQAKTP